MDSEKIYSTRVQRGKRERNKRAFVILLLFFLILIGIFLQRNLFQNKTQLVISPVGMTPFPTAQVVSAVANSPGIEKNILSTLQGENGTYGIFIKNLATDEIYTLHPQQSFESASLYKLWIMAIVFQNIQSGKLQENTLLSKDAQDLDAEFQITPDPTQQSEGTISMSVDDGLQKMITISDNDAALMLTDAIGESSIVSFLKKYGMNNSAIGREGKVPTTTAQDVATFFEKLYGGQFANTKYTEEMIALLKNQLLNEKIPKYLPEDTTIAHKTGELDSFSHDAGIIYTPKGNYIIVVLTNTTDTDHANEIIAEISKNVYSYFFH
ncbi:MAG TPA: serine hydrolase [Patescibacteria group bacterium]|nr:serine hydrolase [Patescibacteria group bacterium]